MLQRTNFLLNNMSAWAEATKNQRDMVSKLTQVNTKSPFYKSSCRSLFNRVVRRASLLSARASSLIRLCSSRCIHECSSINLSCSSFCIDCLHSCSKTTRSLARLSIISCHWVSMRCCCARKSCSRSWMFVTPVLDFSGSRWDCCFFSSAFLFLLRKGFSSSLSSSPPSSSPDSPDDRSPLGRFSFLLTEAPDSDSRSWRCIFLARSVNTACSSSKKGHCLPFSGSEVSFPWWNDEKVMSLCQITKERRY